MRTGALLLAAGLTIASPRSGANAPMRIAILVDTSEGVGTSLTQLREGVRAFVGALPPGHEVMLVTTGRRTQVRVPPTTDYTKVSASAGGLLADHGPTPLLDSLREIDDRFMRKAGGRSPVFVVVTGDGSESSVATDEQAFNHWLDQLAPRGLLADALVLRLNGNGLPDVVAHAVAKATGGHCEVVGSPGRVPDKMKMLAADLGRLRPEAVIDPYD